MLLLLLLLLQVMTPECLLRTPPSHSLLVSVGVSTLHESSLMFVDPGVGVSVAVVTCCLYNSC